MLVAVVLKHSLEIWMMRFLILTEQLNSILVRFLLTWSAGQ